MLLNVLLAILTIQIEDSVEAESYVDDLTIVSQDQKKLQDAMDIIHQFMTYTGQEINQKKTKTFGLAGGCDLRLDGKLLERTQKVKILGVVLCFKNGKVSFTVPDEKIENAITLFPHSLFRNAIQTKRVASGATGYVQSVVRGGNS